MTWLNRITEIVGREGPVARIVVLATHGPTPRAEGSAMLVWANGHEGKIGRPFMEARVRAAALQLLARTPTANAAAPAWLRERLQFPTGDVLGLPTGGSIEVLVEAFGPAEVAALAMPDSKDERGAAFARPVHSGIAPALLTAHKPDQRKTWREGLERLARAPGSLLVRFVQPDTADVVIERLVPFAARFHVYGSGLLARALVRVLADLPFDVVWLDGAPGHFPGSLPAGVAAVVAEDLTKAARTAGPGSFHAVMTADHDLDLAITRTLVEAGEFAYLGVIGSHLKRQRMEARLREQGIGEAALAEIACPIGLPEIHSKIPAVIAVGIAAQALARLDGADNRGIARHATTGSKA